MMAQEIDRRKAEVDIAGLPAVDSAAEEFTGSRAKVELTNLISRLMEAEDPEVLKQEYGYELVEEAISELENRI